MARETKTRGRADLSPKSVNEPGEVADDDGNSSAILIMESFSSDSSPLKRVMSCVTLTFVGSGDSSFNDFTSLTTSLLVTFDSFLPSSSV